MLLEHSRGLNNGGIITGSSHKLKSDRKILLRESTGDGQCRQPADVADSAERIRENQFGFKIQS
jgi:hypothetical protein